MGLQKDRDTLNIYSNGYNKIREAFYMQKELGETDRQTDGD